jgi:hypothetical protein
MIGQIATAPPGYPRATIIDIARMIEAFMDPTRSQVPSASGSITENGTWSNDFDAGLTAFLEKYYEGKLKATHTPTQHDRDTKAVTKRPRYSDFKDAVDRGEAVVARGEDTPNHYFGVMGPTTPVPGKDNQYTVTVLDPSSGTTRTATWTTDPKNLATPDKITFTPEGATDPVTYDVADLWDVSRAANSPPPDYTVLGVDADGSDGWSIPWDTSALPSGEYIIWAGATNADGFTCAMTSEIEVVSPVRPASVPASSAWSIALLLAAGASATLWWRRIELG